MSSLPGFRASLHPSLDFDVARRMRDGSGRKSLELYEKHNRHGSSLRMCTAFLLSKADWYSSAVWLTWKPLVTKSNRLLFRLAPSAPRTGAIGSGLWPTPSASEHTGPGHAADGGMNLRTAVMLPTPKARDWRSPRDKNNGSAKRNSPDLNVAIHLAEGRPISGSLNPDWVEWLMGFPIGWTALDASATPSSRKSSKPSGGQS
mgnify:CR=1 FL=1